MKSVRNQILKRVRGKGRGYAFSAKDFLDIASRGSVDQALSTLATDELIRRLRRGLYDYPRVSSLLGTTLSPELDQVARAIARKHGQRIEPDGPWAANLLGLSTQVPARAVYLTDGLSRSFKIGKHQVRFRHVEPKHLVGRRDATGLVIQGLRYLGRDRVNDEVIQTLRSRFSPRERQALVKDAQYSTDWVYEVVKQVAADG